MKTRITILTIFMTLISSCGAKIAATQETEVAKKTPVATDLPTKVPMAFLFISEIPSDEFLFVFVDDNQSCQDGLCECPVSEPPVYPFEFLDGKLVLNQYFFEKVPNDWVTFRRSNNSTVLYVDYILFSGQLRIFSSFPITTPIGGYTILGANQEGDIQVKINHEYVSVPNGSVTNSSMSEKFSEGCKILHEYTLTNYGFIKDKSVEFFWKE